MKSTAAYSDEDFECLETKIPDYVVKQVEAELSKTESTQCDIDTPPTVMTNLKNNIPKKRGRKPNFSIKNKIRCPDDNCKVKVKSESALLTHLDNVHRSVEERTTVEKKKKMKCTFKSCTKVFKDEAKLNKHMEKHETPEDLSCDECGKRFKFKSYLKHHKTIRHSKRNELICEVCATTFLTQAGLDVSTVN